MRKLVCFMNNRWVKYLMAGSVTVLMVLVIIFIIRSVKENSLVVSCPDTLVVEYGSTDDEADINETIKNKYLKQYNNITFINNDTFHDRFIIIDNNILFTCGASFKDLGKKCFCLSRIEDKEILNSLLKKI